MAAEKGSYLLTDTEEQMLENVCSVFTHTVVVLNTGSIMDMKWAEKYQPSAILYVWQGGMESGNAIADVLSGSVAPSGKLPQTIANSPVWIRALLYYVSGCMFRNQGSCSRSASDQALCVS